MNKANLYGTLTNAFIYYQYRLERPRPAPNEIATAIQMYRSDPIFNAKVKNLVSGVMRIIDEALTVDCKQCANRGQINGTSQELVCDSCIHYGSSWRKDMFVPKNNGE